MVKAIEGLYQDGKIELSESPGDIRRAKVFVVFVSEESDRPREQLLQEVFARMDQGYPLGGGPYLKREEIYDRGRLGPEDPR